MDNRLLLLLGVLSVAALLVFGGKLLARRKIVAGRQPLSFDEIQRLSNAEVRLSTLTRVLTKLGESYGLNPQLIRPTDRLQLFYDLDTWTLGLSAERINKWLTEEGVTAIDPQPTTVLDLIRLFEDHQTRTR